MRGSTCELEEGDRVDHKLFGFGTVDGAPEGGSSSGWRIPVRWDDPNRNSTVVMHYALRKVSSPDSRPFTYWDRQWKPLVQAWIAVRREVEMAASVFRPVPDLDDLARLRDAERNAYEAMQRFWEQEQAGEHS